MGEILGIGCPHGPHLRFTDETMANNYFRINLRNKKTLTFWKDPKSWPAKMRDDWGEDEGVAAVASHRKAVPTIRRKGSKGQTFPNHNGSGKRLIC